jgi:hypothetical protein
LATLRSQYFIRKHARFTKSRGVVDKGPQPADSALGLRICFAVSAAAHAPAFFQPVRVGGLIGLPPVDYGDRTLGSVRQIVVRTPQDKIETIVAHVGRFACRHAARRGAAITTW